MIRTKITWLAVLAIGIGMLAGVMAFADVRKPDSSNQETSRVAPASAADAPVSMTTYLRHVEAVSRPSSTKPGKLKSTASASADVSLPPPETPLEALFAAIEPAAAGDKSAAARLYRDVTSCHAFASAPSAARANLSFSKDSGSLSREQSEGFETRLAEIAEFLDTHEAMCAGLDEDRLAELAFKALLYAARAGDANATACFVAGGFYPGRSLNRENKQWEIQAYEVHALAFAEEAVKRGDWRVVEQILLAYMSHSRPEVGVPLGRLVRPDSIAQYAWMRLAWIGATPTRKDALGARLTALVRSAELAPTDISTADIWADDTFAAYFSDKPSFSSESAGHALFPTTG